uniref:Uncharacterized protein n=1 Tax=Amphimedon queenslandica TaxID=400682 RepID=A0A1X7UQL8_AMPQE
MIITSSSSSSSGCGNILYSSCSITKECSTTSSCFTWRNKEIKDHLLMHSTSKYLLLKIYC